jgi:hypothetical protein
VIDYVQLDGMNFKRDLAAELQGTDGGGDGGVWLANLQLGQLAGIKNQIAISQGINVAGFVSTDWITDTLNTGATQNQVIGFSAFLNGQGGLTNAMIAPFTPTRKISITHTWQVNDPFVHFTLSDLQPVFPNIPIATTNYPILFSAITNNFLVNIGKPNPHYFPWNDIGTPNGTRADPLPSAVVNPAVKDPLVINSDSWNFPVGQPLTLQSIANVHRGTPWQTVYLKSSSVPLATWESWTGNTNDADALLSEPTNDWGIVACLLPYITPPTNPHLTYGFNRPDVASWAPAFQGLTVFTNSPALTPIVIDATTNFDAIAQIVTGINAERVMQPGGLFTNITPLLAVPQLSASSPFVGQGGVSSKLTDAAYEALPIQLLPLLRRDPIGSFASTGGTTQVQFTGFDGYAYIVQGSTNLVDWTPLATTSPTNGVIVFSDADAGNFPKRYYRTMLTP